MLESQAMSEAPLAFGKRIRQKRSQKTYDSLIATAFKLLERREFEDISIAELTRHAGYSVGAFYARFDSKDELFDAMVVQHMDDRRKTRARHFATLSDDTLIRALIKNTVHYYWTRRRFWRAALIRSIRDADFWEPLRKLGHEFADSIIERMSRIADRPLTETEETNVRFAVQVALGTINNTIINKPGPVFMGQAEFVDNLARAFRLVSGYDGLVEEGRRKTEAAAAGNVKARA
jgi:AcrR family transcriptional regulator